MKESTCPYGGKAANYKPDHEAPFSELPQKIREIEFGETIRFPVPNSAWGATLRGDLFDSADDLDAEFSVLREADGFMETQALTLTKYRFGTHHDPIKFWVFAQLAGLAEGELVAIACANDDARFHVWAACEEFTADRRIPVVVTPHPDGKINVIVAERMRPGQTCSSILSAVRDGIKSAKAKARELRQVPAYHQLAVGDKCEIEYSDKSRENSIRVVIYRYGTRAGKSFSVKKARENVFEVTRLS